MSGHLRRGDVLVGGAGRAAGAALRSGGRRPPVAAGAWRTTLGQIVQFGFFELILLLNLTNSSLSSNSRQQYLSQQYPPPLLHSPSSGPSRLGLLMARGGFNACIRLSRGPKCSRIAKTGSIWGVTIRTVPGDCAWSLN